MVVVVVGGWGGVGGWVGGGEGATVNNGIRSHKPAYMRQSLWQHSAQFKQLFTHDSTHPMKCAQGDGCGRREQVRLSLPQAGAPRAVATVPSR